MRANRLIWPAFAIMLTAALAIPSHTLADDDDNKNLLLEQLTQFNGGCPPYPVEEVGGCIDVQFAIHRSNDECEGPNNAVGNVSITEVRDNDDESLQGGSSTLIRGVAVDENGGGEPDGVSTNLSTTNLAPNAPFTMWWVGFNPGNLCLVTCDCMGGDLRPGHDSVFYATGAMSDLLGSATFIANVDYGELPDGEDQTPFDDFANPLEAGAEIHFVIRAHGPALIGDESDDDDD